VNWRLLVGTLRQRRWGLLWFSIGLVSYSWLMVWYWPLVGQQLGELVKSFPRELITAFAGSDVDITTLGGFFQTEYLGLMWIAIVASAVILYAGRAIAGEISNGTMELLLTQPISRLRFALTRAVGLVVIVLVLAVATFLPIRVLGPAYDVDLSTKTLLLLSGSGELLMLAIGGLAFLVSALSREAGRPGAIVGGLLGVMWVGHTLAAFSDFADALEPVNLLYYWRPAQIIDKGTLPAEMWWVYGGVAVVSLAAAVLVFRRRDVA